MHVRSKKGSNNFADLHNSVLSPARFNSIQTCSVTTHLQHPRAEIPATKTLHKGLWDPMELRTVEKAPEQLRERNEAPGLPWVAERRGAASREQPVTCCPLMAKKTQCRHQKKQNLV